MTEELYFQIAVAVQVIEPCPLCGQPAEMWQYSPDGVVATKVVMCSNGMPVAEIESGCPLFMPPDDFYCATQREAARKWNSFCGSAKEMRAGK